MVLASCHLTLISDRVAHDMAWLLTLTHCDAVAVDTCAALCSNVPRPTACPVPTVFWRCGVAVMERFNVFVNLSRMVGVHPKIVDALLVVCPMQICS